MREFRGFLFSLYLWTAVVSVTAFISTLILLSFPLALFDRQRRLAHGLGTLWGNILLRVNPFWRLRVVGAGRIRNDKSYVLVANHSSLSDIVCLFSLGHPFKWLAKKSLFQIPFLGWAMWVMRYISLERGQYGSVRKSYHEALDCLEENISILIFPEGTRSRTGEMGHFKSGAFRLALESGRPIVPIVLAGTEKVISKGKAGFGRTRLAYMSILPPLETKFLGTKEEEVLKKKVEAAMRQEWTKRKRMLARPPLRFAHGWPRDFGGLERVQS